jgi:hypothetical protein
MSKHNSEQVNFAPMEFYRSSAVGISLTKALNTMLEERLITTEAALQILEEFDANFQKLLRENLVIKKEVEVMAVEVKQMSFLVRNFLSDCY